MCVLCFFNKMLLRPICRVIILFNCLISNDIEDHAKTDDNWVSILYPIIKCLCIFFLSRSFLWKKRGLKQKFINQKQKHNVFIRNVKISNYRLLRITTITIDNWAKPMINSFVFSNSLSNMSQTVGLNDHSQRVLCGLLSVCCSGSHRECILTKMLYSVCLIKWKFVCIVHVY